MRDWLPLWSAVEDFARECGCKRIAAYGRPGWLRVLSGYRLKMAIIEKRL